MSDGGAGRGHVFNPTILREYDVRGVVGDTLGEADAGALGRAFAAVVAEKGGKRIAIGRDGRLSPPSLEAALVVGVTGSGIDVVRIGLGPTPMLYFAVNTLDVDGGIMVTGSHNLANYNGFKLMLGKKSFFGQDIQRLGRLAAEAPRPAARAGQVAEKALDAAYIARIVADYDGTRPLHVVWDAGNGATGEVLQRLVQKLPGKHVLHNERIDGRFPAHHPDPTEAKNLVQLQRAVADNRADLGIAFDGDGDRIGVVDGKGRILWGDQFMVVLAGDVIRARPGATIIADVKASQVLFDEVARMGGTPLMWRTGHSLIKTKMAEIGAPLAGEMSGHIFYADRYYGYDDALYAAVRLLGIVSRSGESLAQMRDRLKRAGAAMSDIDGVRVKTGDGWWLLRASNTQDVLVARAEAKAEAGLLRIKALLAEQLRASG